MVVSGIPMIPVVVPLGRTHTVAPTVAAASIRPTRMGSALASCVLPVVETLVTDVAGMF